MRDVHGGNGQDVARRLGVRFEDVLDLSSNTFLACADLARAVIDSEPHAFAHYPDPRATVLRQAVAVHEGVDPDLVLPGNGAAELIWLCFTALRPRRVIMLGPMFSEYARACEALGIAYEVLTPATTCFMPQTADLRALERAEADMAVICLPNNPGGTCYAELPALFHALGDRVILADLSYREFLHGTESYEPTAYRELARLCDGRGAEQGGLVGLHSLTKFFCCPGVRLGYALAHGAMIERLRAHQPPWMVSDFTARVGARLLERVDAFRARLPGLRVWRERMIAALAETGAFRRGEILTGPSFINARLREGLDAAAVRDRLAGQGIVVRACDTIPGMPPGFIRMQVRPPEELERLYRALRAE